MMTDAIGTGTAAGGIEYLDSLVDKGRALNGVVSPLKTALKKILEKTEGEDWPQADISTMDVSDTMARFKNLTMGNYSQGSYRTYELRLVKAIEWYRNFLETPGWYPTETGRAADAPPERLKPSAPDAGVSDLVQPPGAVAETRAGQMAADEAMMITYPFPMGSGSMASLRIPRSVARSDIRRLTAFLEALVVEDTDEAAVR
jgi:hypothetical protein